MGVCVMNARACVAMILLVTAAALARADVTPSNVPGAVSYAQHAIAGGVVPPAIELKNPVAGDAAAAQQGEKFFAAMNCDGCHGVGAVGWVGPSLVDGRWRFGGEDGAVFHSIFYGRPRGMPAYGGILSSTTIWQLVTYLRTQPVPKEVPTVAWP